METEKQNTTSSPMKRAYAAFAEKYEQGVWYLLLLWCLLPIIMCANFAVSAATGRFPSPEELAREGFTLGNVNYDEALASSQLLFFILGGITVCVALALLVLARRRVFSLKALRAQPWFYLFGLFLLWSCVCTAKSDYKYFSLVGGSYMRDGLVSYFIYGAVFLCASALRREDYRRKLMLCFIGVVAFIALIMLVQEATDIFFLNYCFSSARAVVFNQFNHLGYMLCMSSAACFGFFLYESGDKRLKLLYLAGFFFLMYALVVNDTFGALLAVITAIPVALLFYWRSGRKLNWRALGIAVLIVVAAVLIVFAVTGTNGPLGNFIQLKNDLVKILSGAEDADNAGTERFKLWKETVEWIRWRPIFGFGPEGLVRRHALSDNRLPHNTYLQITAFTGFPGLFFYLSALITLAVHHWRKIKSLDTMVLIASGTAFAYMVSQTFGAPIYNVEPYFWLFLGLVTLMNEQEKPLLCPETPEA